jgi:hypothetical protein
LLGFLRVGDGDFFVSAMSYGLWAMGGSLWGERGGGLGRGRVHRDPSRSKDALRMTAGTGNGEEQTTAIYGGPSTALRSGRDDGGLGGVEGGMTAIGSCAGKVDAIWPLPHLSRDEAAAPNAGRWGTQCGGHARWGAGDLYWSLALLTAWCAGVPCAGTRKINGQKRCLRTGLRLDWASLRGTDSG